MRLVKLACLVVMLPVACKLTDGQESDAVVKVTNSYVTDAGPDIVKYERSYEKAATNFCSGTIIGPHTILTAQHCVSDSASSGAFLYASYKGLLAKAVLRHPGYLGGSDVVSTPASDTALIIFAEDIAALSGVTEFRALDLDGPTLTQRVWIIGFGQTNFNIKGTGGGTKHAGCNKVGRIENGYFLMDGIDGDAKLPKPGVGQGFDCDAAPDFARAGENSSAAHGDSGGPILTNDFKKIVGTVSGGQPHPQKPAILIVKYKSFNNAETRNWLTSVAPTLCKDSVCPSYSVVVGGITQAIGKSPNPNDFPVSGIASQKSVDCAAIDRAVDCRAAEGCRWDEFSPDEGVCSSSNP